MKETSKGPWDSLRKAQVAGPSFPRAWVQLGRQGLLGLCLPARYGGGGKSLAAGLPVLEEFGRELGFGGLALAAGAQMWAVQAPLLRFGSPGQKEFLRPLAAGRLFGVPAVTEEAAGSDILAMGCQARPSGGGYVLDGRKTYVSGAAQAGLFLVWAKVAGRSGPLSLACFIIERASRGLATHRRRWSIGPAGSGMGTLVLRGVRVRAARRLGAEGEGLKVFSHAMTEERRLILAPAVGAMERRLKETAAYAAGRRQFGRAVSAFQAVSHRLADMTIRWEACRGLLRWAAGRPDDETLASVTKTFISESWVANCLDAIELHGARGCADSDSLRDELGAALSSRLMSGTNEIQRNLIARGAR